MTDDIKNIAAYRKEDDRIASNTAIEYSKDTPMYSEEGVDMPQVDPNTQILGYKKIINDITDRLTVLEKTTLLAGETETGYCGGGTVTEDNNIAYEIRYWVSFKKECVNTPSIGNISLHATSSNTCYASVIAATKYGFMLLLETADYTGWARYWWYGTYTVTVPS